MRYTTPAFSIDDGAPFEHDIFDRKAYGEALMNIASNSTDALVISLDGRWGEGKTTFIKMWQRMLDEHNVPNIYIDAFANDYIDDAFISIASAITGYAEKNIKRSKSIELKKLKENTKKVGGRLLSWSARLAIKTATLGVINNTDIDALESIKDNLSEDASDLVGDYIEQRISAHTKDIEVIESFKDYLSTLPQKLQSKDTCHPLIIVIDELDRCRPNFAVEIIEKTKHLFSVKNVVFMLVMNKTQLEESIKCVYGQNIDAHTYLQKFVHVDAKLPKNTRNSYHISDHERYIARLFAVHELETWDDTPYLSRCIKLLSEHFDLSLRQLEKVFTNIAIIYSSLNKNSIRIQPIITLVSILKVSHPRIYNDLQNRNITFKNLRHELKIPHYNDFAEEFGWVFGWLEFSLISNHEYNGLPPDHDLRVFHRALSSHNLSRENIIPFYMNRLNLIASSR